MLRNALCQNVSIIFSYYLCYMYYNIYGIEHDGVICQYDFYICEPYQLYWHTPMSAELIECHDKENEKCLSSLWVLNAGYSWWELLWFRKIQNKVNLFYQHTIGTKFSLDHFIINLRLYLPSWWLIKFRIQVHSDWQVFVFNFKN